MITSLTRTVLHFAQSAALITLVSLLGCADRRDASETFLEVSRWHTIAIDTSGIDHQGAPLGGSQLGPLKSARAMAMVHLALFESLNTITPRFESYLSLPTIPESPEIKSSMVLAQAAHDVLTSLYPRQKDRIAAALLNSVENTPEAQRAVSRALGSAIADEILAHRLNDGSELSTAANENAYQFSGLPGRWRRDPTNPQQTPVGTRWTTVRPFVMQSPAQFRAPPPPALGSSEYAEACADVARLGGDGVTTPTARSAEQTEIGIYWAYDGVPTLCAPPRLYNQIALQIGIDQGIRDPLELARYLALINLAMADAGSAIWESKYYYDHWRPITAIRESDAGTGPSGLGDGNASTIGDPTFTPLGAPASNLNTRNFTPPFPSYPGGHGGFGAALFQTIRRYFGRDEIAFTFVSDELNGVTQDVSGAIRPLRPRSFDSLTEAELENARSRIYLGIHFEFDSTAAIDQGRAVANLVFESVLRPRE